MKKIELLITELDTCILESKLQYAIKLALKTIGSLNGESFDDIKIRLLLNNCQFVELMQQSRENIVSYADFTVTHNRAKESAIHLIEELKQLLRANSTYYEALGSVRNRMIM